MATQPRPFDFHDLERLIVAHLGVRNVAGSDGWADDDLADLLGVTVASLRQYRYARHMLTARMADRLACAAGYHPSLVWPHWFDESAPATPADEELEARREKRRTYMRNYMRTYRKGAA